MDIRQIRLVLRIRFDAQASKIPLGAKHGCDPTTEAPGLIKISKSLDLDVSSPSSKSIKSEQIFNVL